jgi:hypothetical protein
MVRVKNIVLKLLMVLVILSSVLLMPGFSHNTIVAEAATQAPSLKENNKTLYVNGGTYNIKLKNVVKGAKIIYSSKNKKIAVVNKDGKIIPKSEGVVDIIVAVKQNGKTYELVVGVTVGKPCVELTQSVDYLNVGEEAQFKAIANGTVDKISWSVSDETMATISSSGKMTALAAGKVILTAKAGDLTAELEINIGTNRINTLLKNITIYEDTTLWITTITNEKDEALTVTPLDNTIVRCKWGEWDGNRIPLKLKVLGKGQDTLTITSDISNDRLVIQVKVVDKPKDKKNLSAVELYEKCGGSTVEIAASTDYTKSIGSGFFIGDGMLVTNYHVIQGMKNIVVTTSGNKVINITKILGYDEKLDLAILQVDEKYKGLAVSNSKAKVGEKIYTLGSPLGLTGTMTDGMITTATRLIDDVDYIQINASISSGNSGGPLINAYGEVIGVNTMYFVNGQNLNFAININELKKVYLNSPLTVDEYYNWFKENAKKRFEESMILEDTSKSHYLDTCQQVPMYNGVSGTMQSSEKLDLYYFKVTKPCWVWGYVYSNTVEDTKNTYFFIYDEDINEVALANEYPEDKLQYFEKYLNPGTYYVCIDIPEGYTGADVPYMFVLCDE